MGVGSYTSNQWYNIVITNTGGTFASGGTYVANSSLVSYVNGVQTNSASYVRWSPLNTLKYSIGFPTTYTSNGYFNGQIGGFKQYSVALSAAQVQQNYNAWAWRFNMPLLYTPFSFPGGLVFHLDAGNKQSYPGSGTTWTDLVSAATMTLMNGPTYSSNFGGYINFVGSSSQYATTSTSFQSTPNWSVEVWHYYNNTGSAPYGAAAIVSQNYPGTTSTIQFVLGSSSGSTVTAAVYNGGWNQSAGYTLPTSNAWYHIVGNYTGSNLNVYVNGSLVVTTASTITAASNAGGFKLMGRWDAPTWPDYWGGGLAIVRIYSKALDNTEVRSLFNATRTRFAV